MMNAERGMVALLKICAMHKDLGQGSKLHADILKQDLLRKNVFIGSALVTVYAKAGSLAKAHQVFDELSLRNRVSWTALITAYIGQGLCEEAVACFEWMQHDGLSPDSITFASILKACGNMGAADMGECIHDTIVKRGLLQKDNVLSTSLLDMYAKCGALSKAQNVFDQLCVRDVISWTALITGYCQHGLGEKALDCFEKMQHEGHSPNAMTFACILKACGKTGATEKGREIHVEIVREGLLGKDRVLGSVLVDMYAKCGALTEAQEVFEKLPIRDVVSWTALIEGYCQQGYGEEAVKCFERMEWEGLSPDPVVFISLLKACRSIGSADKGGLCFEAVSATYGIVPTLEHHSCLLSLYGRQGLFDEAITAIEKMPMLDDLSVWLALMDACQKWGNVELGRLAFHNAIQLNAKAAVAYVCMSRMYAAAGMHEEAGIIKSLRKRSELHDNEEFLDGTKA